MLNETEEILPFIVAFVMSLDCMYEICVCHIDIDEVCYAVQQHIIFVVNEH